MGGLEEWDGKEIYKWYRGKITNEVVQKLSILQCIMSFHYCFKLYF
jgi:hypothetical protein